MEQTPRYISTGFPRRPDLIGTPGNDCLNYPRLRTPWVYCVLRKRRGRKTPPTKYCFRPGQARALQKLTPPYPSTNRRGKQKTPTILSRGFSFFSFQSTYIFADTNFKSSLSRS